MPDLKPCPFCGAEPTIYDIEPHEHHLSFGGVKLPDYPGSTVIECGCGCGAGLIDESRELVVKRWNTRVESAAVAAEREACADAESDAGRLALELECLIISSDMPTVSRWWESANEALDLHRSRLDAIGASATKGGE